MLTLSEARREAVVILSELSPVCERCEIAGSIRRRKPNVKDIEIVCIPRSRDLWGFADLVNRWEAIKGSPAGRYTQRRLPSGVILDLFMADRVNYGTILLIRTGDADFSKHVAGLLLPEAGFRQRDGYVRKDGVIVPTPEEEDVFRLIGLPFIPPEDREGHAALSSARSGV